MDTFKKLSAGLKSLRTLKVLACIFSSLYLTAYIDLYMLRSTWMCLPVFWVILAVFMLLSLSRRTDRLFGFILRPQTAQLSIVAAVLLLAFAFLCRKAQGGRGVVELGGRTWELLSGDANYGLLYAGAVIALVTLVVAAIGISSMVLYAVSVAWVLIMAVYYTVKLM